MEIQGIKIEQIKPYKNNAKKHSETQIANVAESVYKIGRWIWKVRRVGVILNKGFAESLYKKTPQNSYKTEGKLWHVRVQR